MPLPTPPEYGLPDDATVVVPIPPAGLTLYRLIETEPPALKDFEERRTRPQAERDGIPELFRLSVSHWLTHERAGRQSRRRRFYVARLELRPGSLTRVALTEAFGEGHVDVWAHPQHLLDAVVEVVGPHRHT